MFFDNFFELSCFFLGFFLQILKSQIFWYGEMRFLVFFFSKKIGWEFYSEIHAIIQNLN
jgi:hypothetical protein